MEEQDGNVGIRPKSFRGMLLAFLLVYPQTRDALVEMSDRIDIRVIRTPTVSSQGVLDD